MVLPIYTYGQPVLRKVAEDIPLDYPDLQELIQNMFETNTASDGVGLAVLADHMCKWVIPYSYLSFKLNRCPTSLIIK